MLYLAIPAHNEVATIGVLLWRLRTVLAEFPREYEVVVYDDASTDETAEVATQYEQAMPVTVLRGQTHLGYAGAVDLLLRHVAAQTRYPRRDAVLLLQGDFTDPPEIVPEFARRFEGGADLVVGERLVVADAPVAVRRLFKGAHWAMRPFVRVDGVRDLTASMRLVRISSLREALRVVGEAPLITGDTWTANADLLLHLTPHARRVESVPMEPTYGVRMRETRRVAMRDALGALKWAWGARGRRAAIGSADDGAGEGEKRGPRGATSKRRDEPELSIERLREKVRERDGSQGIDGAEPESRRNRRTARDRERPRSERPTETVTERPERSERPARPERTERPERPVRPERAERPESAEGEERAARPPRERKERTERPDRPERNAAAPAPRGPKPPRGDRPARPRRDETRSTIDEAMLDDPFAPPPPRLDPLARALDTPSVARPASSPSTPPPADRSPYADADDPADGEPSAEREERGRVGGPRDRAARRAPEAEAVADETTTEGENAGEREGDDHGADGAEEGVAGADTPARKRRRNRRSRRGRKRREGVEGSEVGDGDRDSDGDGEGDRDRGGDSTGNERAEDDDERPILERPARHHRDREDEDDDESAEGGEIVSDGTPEGDAAAQRARRRGRRGRRGGARRSRGRRERGDGQSDGQSDAPSDESSNARDEGGGESGGPSDRGAGPDAA